MSSLRRGHANLLCIVPVLSDVPEGSRSGASSSYINALSLLLLCNVGLVEGSLVKFGALWAFFGDTNQTQIQISCVKSYLTEMIFYAHV